MGWSTTDRIVVRGHDLVDDLIGKVSLGDMAFLELKGRLPTEKESVVFNALAVTLVEHGMTPSAIATRLTYFGAPESIQAAVAAGLLGIGDRFGGSIEEAARTLQEALAGTEPGADLRALAGQVVARYKERKRPIAGVVEAIDNSYVKPSPAGRIGHRANFSLAIDEPEARTKWLHATRGQVCQRAEREQKEDTQTGFLNQDGAILPGRAMRVKAC